MRSSILPLVILPALAIAETINIPADYPTIQAGIDAASPGDTVLVYPGTYYEQINFEGKNIVVGSLVLTTRDTSFIRRTVIDARSKFAGVLFNSGEDTSAVLMGFTIRNASGRIIGSCDHCVEREGAGIICINAAATLSDLRIENNIIELFGIRGAGIWAYRSILIIRNSTIIGNRIQYGGGIYAQECQIRIENTRIYNNEQTGILAENSTIIIKDSNIRGNEGWDNGGIHLMTSDLRLINSCISRNRSRNRGGGILAINSNVSLIHASIINNLAEKFGGGLALINSTLETSIDELSNIYLNSSYRRNGTDLYSDTPAHVYLDTFTVVEPDSILAYPIQNFTFDIQHPRIELTAGDLYVSPTGSDLNSGTTINESLRSITSALVRIRSDATGIPSIFISNGVYSSSASGDIFPLIISNPVYIIGESKLGVLIDAEKNYCVFSIYSVDTCIIQHLTVENGNGSPSGGMVVESSSINISDIIFRQNAGTRSGALEVSNSIANLENVEMLGNEGGMSSAIYCSYSSLDLMKVLIAANKSTRAFGSGSAIYGLMSDIELVNITVTGVSQSRAIFLGNGTMSIVNSILWNNTPQEIVANTFAEVEISYSDIEDWETSVIAYNEAQIILGDGLINAHPQFCSPNEEDYALASISPCLMTGEYGANMGAFGLGCDSVLAFEDLSSISSSYALLSSYPNPFNPSTTIGFELPARSDVSLIIYNLTGREVARLADSGYQAGYHQVVWDGRNASGRLLPSGIYIARLVVPPKAGVTPEYTKSIKMLLLK